MGVAGFDLSSSEDPQHDLQIALHSEGPALINIPIQAEEMVLPMVAPGGAIRDMIEAAP